MKKTSGLVLMLIIFCSAFSQYNDREELELFDTQLELFKKYAPYADAHIHPTYKHYFKPRTAKLMLIVLSAAIYDDNSFLIGFDSTIGSKYWEENWKSYKTSLSAMSNGRVATFGK